MLLAFDVGNTNIVLGLFQDGKMITNWRLETDNNKSADEYGMIINQLFKYENLDISEVKDVIISTVVPSVLYTLQHLSVKYFHRKAIVIGAGIKTGLVVKYDNPKQVGADRIVNAVAAHAKYGGPLIIIDFGTATTFCAVSEQAEYLGGTIAPGLKISSDALFEKTAKLPKVELEEPGHVICRNTINSIQGGLVYGHMGMVDYIVKKMKKELLEYSDDPDQEVKVIATGGLATLIDGGIDCIDYVDKKLTLEGMETATMAKTAFKIGDITLKTPFVLAPLAGITDTSMRSLCWKQGASFVYTEMVSGKGLWYGDKKTKQLLKIGDPEEMTGFQLFGSDPEVMAFAAKELKESGNALLDLNVGCPVPKVVKNGEGSALLKKLDVLQEVVAAMVKHAGKPVTAKIRMGFARNENTAVETAKALEDAGAAAVAVHGRTREQYYEGKADWKVIAEVKHAVSIPVIGNGDVMSGEDAVRMLDETGCDGVMIARGALGNPWIFQEAEALWRGEMKPVTPTDNEKINMLLHHFALIREDKGDNVAVREIRKHIGWYVKGMRGASYIKRTANQITQPSELIELLRGLLK